LVNIATTNNAKATLVEQKAAFDAEMDRIVKHCRQLIAGQKRKLKCFGVKSDMTFEL